MNTVTERAGGPYRFGLTSTVGCVHDCNHGGVAAECSVAVAVTLTLEVSIPVPE